MITKIDKRCNLFNRDSFKDFPIIFLGYNCLINYKEAQFKGIIDYLKFKREKETLKDLSSILHLFGKFPERASYSIQSKKIGKIVIVCKPFFKDVIIEQVGDFQRTDKVFYKDQVDFFKKEFEKHKISSDKKILVDISTLVSFDQKEENDFINFFAEIHNKVELFY